LPEKTKNKSIRRAKMSKHLILTGGAGFIGHHTIEHVLKNTDWNITVIDRLTYAGNLNRITDLECWEKEKGRVRFHYHDFRSPMLTGGLILSPFGKPHYLIHMGAESHVDRSIEDPMPFVKSNVQGTVNMLQLARDLNIERYIQVSTDEVYGPMADHLHVEGEPHKPGNPYAASKAGAEDFCKAFHNTYGLPVIITNTMNNFGERQDIEKFVPKTIRRIYLHEPVIAHVKINEKGEIIDISSRCWLHARNHADALIFLLQNGNPGEQYNVTGELLSVTSMIQYIARFMNVDDYDLRCEDFHSFRKGHDMHYGLDGTKLSKLGWRPKFDLINSLERTVKWSLDEKNRRWLNL
jgi:dTDP-glucose 4,6-dehydratase